MTTKTAKQVENIKVETATDVMPDKPTMPTETPKIVAKKQSKTTRVHIPMETFLNAYKANETYEAVANVLGVQVTTVQQRVYSYKKRGVNIIPKSNGTRGAKPLDIERANAILAE